MNLIINNRIIDTPIVKILKQVKSEINTGKLSTYQEKHDNVMVTCPFHKDGKESHPSCNVYCGDNKEVEYGWFKCFTCGEQGSLTKFIGECFNSNHVFGKDWLLERFGNTVIERKIELIPIDFKKPIPQYLDESVLDTFQKYHPYMTQRNMTSEVIEKFKIRYDTETKSLVFPVWDDKGKLFMLTRRSVVNKTFIIDKDKEKPVYLLNFIKQSKINNVYVCESQINALTLWSWNYPAIALFGTGTKRQYEILAKSGIRVYNLCLDGDSAGDKGISNFIENLGDKGAIINIVKIPRGKDVNDLTKEEFDNLLLTA
jgi:DNA primase